LRLELFEVFDEAPLGVHERDEGRRHRRSCAR
jgi:hypothetical protein